MTTELHIECAEGREGPVPLRPSACPVCGHSELSHVADRGGRCDICATVKALGRAM